MDLERTKKAKTQLDNVYNGCLDDIPAMQSRLIRVFCSSTFTDTSIERNYLMTYSVPKLRQTCFMKELEFQLIDMRWGVRDEASIDHTTTEIVVDEVIKSMKISRGPYLVAFLTDKYGSRPVPNKIEAKEFKLLRRVAMKHGHDVSDLDEWFQRDDNAEPAVYYLLPITNILPNYNNEEEEQVALREKDRAEWNRVEKKITKILRYAANEAFEEGLITKEDRQKYLRSVTESELTEAILNPVDVKSKVICYFRSFMDMKLKDFKSARYTDKRENGELDHEAEELRERLKWSKIQPKLGPDEQQKYALYWTSEGIDSQEPDHQEYLQHLGKDFEARMLKMIDNSLKSDDLNFGMNKKLCFEIMHHLHFIKRKCEIFCGREEFLNDIHHRLTVQHGEKQKVTFADDTNQLVDESESDNKMDVTDLDSQAKFGQFPNFKEDLEEIKRIKKEHEGIKKHLKELDVIYNAAEVETDLESDPNRDLKAELLLLPRMETYSYPLIIHGDSGSGKTTVMAKIAELSHTWFPGSVLMVRFLGTSQSSTSVRDLLLGLCLQIWHVYNISHPVNLDLEEDFQFLYNYFYSLLWRIDSRSKPLVLILDSVDQLSSNDHAYSMHWLPCKVPPDVHIIVSTLSQVNNCLNNISRKMTVTDQYMRLPPLQPQAMDEIITRICKQKNRRVTKLQRRFLINRSVKCGQPLFTKLIADQALQWKSSTTPTDVGNNTEEAIYLLFEHLEKEHGEILVKRMFGSISAARDGLSINEIEDVLSLDDRVLQDSYLYHLPPDPYLIRIPIAVMTRVEKDVAEYLVGRQSGSVMVMNWYHRQFKELSAKRYLSKEDATFMHTLLADYFLGTYYNKEKPLELYKKKKGQYLHAQRGVKSQPIKFGSIYNTRKLVELPHHLIKSHQFAKFRDVVACSFEWLYAKAKTLSVVEVLDDLMNCLDAMDDRGYLDAGVYSDIKSVMEILHLGIDSIRKDVSNIAVQVIARLGNGGEFSESLNRLKKDADKWCEESQLPLLVPRSRCMMAPGGVLLTSISVQMFQGNAKRCHDADVNRLYFCESKKQLYVLQPRLERLDYGVMAVYDYLGTCIVQEKLPVDAVALTFLGKEKYIHLRDGKNNDMIFSGTAATPVNLPSEGDKVTVSSSGKFIVYASASKVYVCGSKRPLSVKFELDIKMQEEDEVSNEVTSSDNEKVILSKEMTKDTPINLGENVDASQKVDSSQENGNVATEEVMQNQASKEDSQEGQGNHFIESESKFDEVPQQDSSTKAEEENENSEELAKEDVAGDENSAQQEENDAQQDENVTQQDENNGKQDENVTQQDENNGQQDENNAQQDENDAQQVETNAQQDENDAKQDENNAETEENAQQDENDAQQEENNTQQDEDDEQQNENNAQQDEIDAEPESNTNQQEGKDEDKVESSEQDSLNPENVDKENSKKNSKEERHSKKKRKKHKKSKKKPKEKPIQRRLEDKVRLLLTSPDEQFLVALNSSYSYFRVWKLQTGEFLYDVQRDVKKEVFTLSGMDPYSEGEAVTLITKDNCLIYRSFGYSCQNSLEVFDLEEGQFLTTIVNGEQNLAMISLHTSQKFLAVGNGVSSFVWGPETKSSRKAVWNVWDIRKGEIVSDGSNPKMYKKDSRLRSLKIFGKHHMFVMTVVDYVICLAYCGTVDNPSPMAIPYKHLYGHSGIVVQLSVSADENIMFSAGSDNTVKVWDVAKIVSEFTEKYGTAEDEDLHTKMEAAYENEDLLMKETTSLAFHSDGDQIFAGTSDGHLTVQTVKDDHVILDTDLGTEALTHMLIASKSPLVIVGSSSGKIFTWDVQKCETDKVFDLKKSLACMAEANDILIAASAGMEGKGHVWNIKTGDFIKEVSLLYSFYSVAINSTGTKIVSTMFDFPLVVNLMSENDNNIDTNSMDTMMASAFCVAISPNDRLAFSGSVDGSIRVVSMSGGKYIYRLCQKSSVSTARFSPDSKYIVSGGFRSIYVWSMEDASLKFKVKKHDNFLLDFKFNKTGSHMVSSGQDKRIVMWDFRRGISLTTFYAQNQPDLIDFGCHGDVVFYPEHIATSTTLRPNPVLSRMLKGEYSENLSSVFTKAQGLALSFSSQKVRQQTAESGMCVIL